MSVAIRFERLIPSVITETTPSRQTPRFAEAPDCGGQAREAPEIQPGHSFEAPDAGLGQSNHAEYHFTHGRSQS
jgi:hypothetical protein